MRQRPPSGTLPVLLLLFGAAVTLAITAFSQWQGRERAEAKARETEAQLEKSRKEHAAALDRITKLRQRVTRAHELDFDDLIAAMDEDIRTFGRSPTETYSDIVRNLRNSIDNLDTQLKQIVADKDQLQSEYVALQAVKQSAVNEAAAAAQEARQELMTERADFYKKLAVRDDEVAAIMDRAKTLAARLETEQRDKSRIQEELLGEVNKLRRILMDARAPHTPDALAKQKPDGKIIRSSAATKTAWVNVGSKHGVQPQFTFSVQPSGFSGNPYTKPKAKLEIVSVAGSDLSEARILESNLRDPIIEGDLIFNPAWDPGKVLRFALAGLIDLDDDGSDDRDQVRQIILKSGAKIDAEVELDGGEKGAVTVETDYFVRGRRPDPEKAGPAQLRVLSAMAKMERTAIDYGATVIDIDKFLDLMGYAPKGLNAAGVPPLSPVENPLRNLKSSGLSR